ncbi:MAG: glycosyltransferase family 2 protein [Coriobacteriales bacterium]|jgi:GT2 family glycosyltransferase|nr:glycosyltransferase family 2 protein [Coriobacteriales bacterium]
MSDSAQQPKKPRALSWGNLVRILRSIHSLGFRVTLRRVRNRLRSRKQAAPDTGFVLDEKVFAQQRSHVFRNRHSFSILVPLYNTPLGFLRPMIESVQNQSYEHWELCLADASDDAHTEVGACCQEYAQADPRIVYQKLTENRGIAANTNSALELAGGDYCALLDHDDVLHPSALYAVAECIEAQGADMVYTDEITFSGAPEDGYFAHFKPSFSPDTLRSYNYICHFLVFSRELQRRVGLFKSECDGSQDYDFILRLSEQATCIRHIPRILYYWRAHPHSVAAGAEAKTYALAAAKRALSAHLARVGLAGSVEDASLPTVYRIRYKLQGEPLVSIIIPNKDHAEDLGRCLESIVAKSSYRNYELLIVENNSTQSETFAFYQTLKQGKIGQAGSAGSCQSLPVPLEVLEYEGGFNFSAINNFAVRRARGEVLLFLNNDTEVISPDWIQEMLMFAQRPDVAAAGARLLYPDGTVQHAGVILGIGGVAGHAHKTFRRDEPGYASRLQLAQNISAVTGACLMVRKEVFEEVGGFDEDFSVAFNDIDLCMRFRAQGYLNVFTPFAELYHHESKSRGLEDTAEKLKRFRGESLMFQRRWSRELEAGDPYYNPNLTLAHEDFSLQTHRTTSPPR